ncbi:phosphoribosylformylglycinamidine synthase subunit PurQ [Natronomonas pharaonis DSM 2160]|uniref:Phosphoribosylformylglycinamidine synthase subunit PurQ n=1 Tax=Natronomonas pharaonis (strain ATCC 35678 / DSM 2160 / CIP 103997 / JCM 8858 / NBRC 14720 / NCIMB 2260 / Gabara) TaxID=348780 RepID=PURQ_NATPD|nr:phosphoribosylformylglycinamidine synthase I [Natronomonas pharaonis]Q3IMR2.1 RecName: Full=Phosphoribosylformylglycinamidine synthase subunit PurQ; Short=FGAM synthase; AltName: Full=Formylglycinamide ribonucleotide amidotransferase subunit I; Short=FGAR amidotransferase I; Short=FGAR-AT I; AltName: Full=Glutaminase PurQ; AltName: Full=Phosphoribosylformylglycinamidine synthase subunit I [Natronomonas pharaonis DSM 2160]CAI50596.1 phosphoribosylformylglycinamidine synthase subunit PurQ [Natro
MTVAIIRFGGSNCDRDAERALAHLDIDAEIVWHEDGLPEETTGVMIPGGFSYGDYLRAGAMAARAPIMDDVREQAEAGVPVLGVCNGAQIGSEGDLTPGAFTTNRSARFQCEPVYLRVENAETPWTEAYEDGEVIEVPIAHGEGRFEIADDELETLVDEDRVIFRYCDADGNVTDAANPNGSKDNVAGVLGEHESVAVLMPHPERASLPDIGPTDGQGVLEGFR